MPIYEYRCSICGNEQENLVRAGSDTPVCEKCGEAGLNKKLSIFAVSNSASSPAYPSECACASGNGGGCPGASHSSGGCGHSGGCGCAG